MKTLPPPPKGKPPQEPHALLEYAKKKALSQGLDPDLVRVPGANAPMTAEFYFPGQWRKNPQGNETNVPKVMPKSPIVQELYVPTQDTDETDEEVIIRIQARFNTLDKVAENVMLGKHQAVIVSGAGGVGKTFLIEKKSEYYKEHHNLNIKIVRGGIVSDINLFQLLWHTRMKGSVLVLDDSDNIFGEEGALTLLKGVLDTNKNRRCAWMKESNILANAGIDREFEYHGNIIFVTNINFNAYIEAGKGKLLPHIQALRTRVHYLDLKLHTDREKALWVEHVVTKNHILVADYDVTMAQEQEAIKWMLDHRDRLASLSIRTALFLGEYIRDYGHAWKQVASDMLLV